ncbi:MAG: cytochrome C oxidase subunit IV family protein [Acidobacteriia bacterium]|nr:cytochrome C oxidase subunit IV family protein [Terriglobia bacterium]
MSSHVTPKKTYFAVFGTLMALTALTVAAATVDLGGLNTVVALAIAGCKAGVVIWFFMEVRHARPMTRLTVAAGILWLVIMLILLSSDYISRGWLGRSQGW